MADQNLIIPLNLPVANPTLATLLGQVQDTTTKALNCVGVGTVNSVSVNGTNHLLTGTASLDYAQTFFERKKDGTYNPVTKDYPQLIDCPVVVMGGGAGAVNQPIQPGDRCLILFNDVDLNNWFAGARSGPVATARSHAFSDALILVGFQQLGTLDTSRLMFTDGDANAGINVDTHKVRISNQTAGTLYTVLSNLITAIEGITILGATPGTVSPASVTALEAARTAVNSLLE